MSRGQFSAVVRGFGRLFGGGGTVAGLGEGQLLERFVATRDEAAFEALVARHGPMVVGVCRRLLDDPRDVEDAFQAVFLVLVRRAAAIRDRDRLGPWLYGVALKVAHRARQQAARRRAREKGGDAVAAFEPASNGDGPPDDLGLELHEELGRLPAKYRDPIVLCDLEGRTHEEAARLLRWPIGTVKGRLSRARDRLRDRLLRRGLAPSVATIVLALQHDARAAVPPFLLDRTVRAAMGVAAGAGISALAGSVSAPALGLADGVVSTMILAKLKSAAAVVLATGAVTMGTVGFAFQFGGTGRGGQPDQPQSQPDGAEAVGKSERITITGRAVGVEVPRVDEVEKARRDLERARLGPVRDAYDQAVLTASSGGGVDQVRAASVALMQAEMRLEEGQAPPVAAVQGHVERMERLKHRAFDGGIPGGGGFQQSPIPPGAMEVLEAEARLWLAEAKAGRPLTGLDEAAGAMGTGMGMMGAGMGMMMSGMAPANPEPATTPGMEGAAGGGMMSSMAPGGPIASYSQAEDPQNRAIIAVLEKPLMMAFPDPVPLSDVLKFIREATKGPEFPSGLPIYVDPSPGVDGGTSQGALEHQVAMELDGVRLKTTLRLLLKQAGLGYIVKDGVILVGHLDSETFEQEISPNVPADGGVPGYGAMPRASALGIGPGGMMRGAVGGMGLGGMMSGGMGPEGGEGAPAGGPPESGPPSGAAAPPGGGFR
jgi:RNA polymerase sigma factor (sigma-70 family)